MRPGRKSKSAELHILQGNPGGKGADELKARADSELSIAPKLPAPPKHLLPEAKREWKRTGKKLAEIGLITEIDRAMFALYCQAWAHWEIAERNVQAYSDEGYVQTGQYGEKLAGWIQIAWKAAEQVSKIAREFGMTPATRYRVTVAKPEKPADDKPEHKPAAARSGTRFLR